MFDVLRSRFWHEAFVPVLAAVLHPNVYVEVGIEHGNTFRGVLPFVRRAIGVDINPACRNAVGERGEFFLGTAREFVHANPEIRIDLAFIDADHAKAAVLDDFDALAPCMSAGGLLLLHDTFPFDGEAVAGCSADAYLALDEIEAQGYSTLTLCRSPGITLLLPGRDRGL